MAVQEWPNVLNGREAARYLRLGGPTFRRLVDAGEIPVWVDPLTGRRRYPRLALDAHLAAQTPKPRKRSAA